MASWDIPPKWSYKWITSGKKNRQFPNFKDNIPWYLIIASSIPNGVPKVRHDDTASDDQGTPGSKVPSSKISLGRPRLVHLDEWGRSQRPPSPIQYPLKPSADGSADAGGPGRSCAGSRCPRAQSEGTPFWWEREWTRLLLPGLLTKVSLLRSSLLEVEAVLEDKFSFWSKLYL